MALKRPLFCVQDLLNFHHLPFLGGFPGGSDSKESVCNAGDLGSIPGSRRSPGEGNGNPFILAYKNPWTEAPCRLQFMGVAESDMTEQLHLNLYLNG